MEHLFLKLGIQCANSGLWEEAEKAFRQALTVNPNYAQALSNLGFVLKQTHHPEEAEAFLRKALKQDAGLIGAYNNLSLILMDTNRAAEAENLLCKAIRLAPSSPDLYNNLGSALQDLQRPRQAETAFRRAIECNPSFVYAYYNLGCLLKSVGRLDEAAQALACALTLRPDYKSAQLALASLYLLRGQFEKGWQLYNLCRMKKFSSKAGDLPLWQGEDLTGKQLLLFHEQGFGDTIQFSRYLPQAAALARRTVFWVQQQLHSLISSSYPEITLHTSKTAPDMAFDFACPLPNLPMLFKTTAETIPQQTPYLKATEARIHFWREALAAATPKATIKIGLVWAGNPKHHNDRNRSLPLAAFQPLLTLPETAWISLQLPAQIIPRQYPLLDYTEQLVDFSETSALIENLDLVITVDSAVAHLAGALGKEAWVLIPFEPDWRWQLARPDSPWYPGMRLFRQKRPGDWQAPLKEVKKRLEARLSTSV